MKSGCAFLCLLSFAQAKESMVAHRAKSELTTSKEKVSRPVGEIPLTSPLHQTVPDDKTPQDALEPVSQ